MKYIGKEYERVDGKDKVTGKAKYVDDYYFDNMLYVSVVRSSICYGKIKNIDTSKAFIDGVVGIYTSDDFPGDNSYGFPICDDTILSKGVVKYIGDAIAIVCAEDKKTANKAAKLVRVDYEECKPVLEAGNKDKLLKKLVIKKNIDKDNNNKDDLVLNMKIKTKRQEHMYIEPEGAVAYYDDNKCMVVKAPMQSPFVAKGIVKKIMGLDDDKVHLIQSTVGGSFGGKDDCVYEACGFVALGTYKTKRPCKYVASREESIVSSYKRHGIESNITLSADKDGYFKNIKVRTTMDGGPYAAASPFVQYRNTTHSAGPYVYDKVDVENELYYSNNVYCSAFRGFGGLQACFVYDTAVDEMSYKLNMDPIELRLKNIWRRGTTTPTNQKVDWDPAIEEVLLKAREISDWNTKRNEFREFNKKNKYYKKGIGVSLGYHGISLGAEGTDFGQSEVIYDRNNKKLMITSGITELGQGTRTVFSMIASEVLNLPPECIEVNNFDTNLILDSGPTVASRGSTIGGNAVIAACKNFLELLKEKIAKRYKNNIENVVFKDGNVYLEDKKIDSIMEICDQISKDEELRAYGRFDMPNITWKEENGLGTPYMAYHYGAHVCYLTVDTITGMVKVDKYFSVHDVGKVLNPTYLRGQVNGGVVMGIGYSLMEDLQVHDGIIENKNFDKYIIPTVLDAPDIKFEAVESNEPIGPFGAKGVGEPVLTPVPSCIGNAIRFATGKRIDNLPFSLEKIVLGKELSKYGKH